MAATMVATSLRNRRYRSSHNCHGQNNHFHKLHDQSSTDVKLRVNKTQQNQSAAASVQTPAAAPTGNACIGSVDRTAINR
jgi:hypothetical protein